MVWRCDCFWTLKNDIIKTPKCSNHYGRIFDTDKEERERNIAAVCIHYLYLFIKLLYNFTIRMTFICSQYHYHDIHTLWLLFNTPIINKISLRPCCKYSGFKYLLIRHSGIVLILIKCTLPNLLVYLSFK